MKGRLKRALDRILPGDSLLDRAVTGGLWEGATNVVDRSIHLATLVVLARLLDPEAFGLMGMTLLVLHGVNRFTRLGIDESLIQHQADSIDEYLDTAWTLNVARGVLLCAFIVLVAPLFAAFFDRPDLVDLVRVIAIAPLVAGFGNPGIVYLDRELAFHRYFVYRVGTRIAASAVGVGYALTFGTVWALVAAVVVNRVVALPLSYLVHSYRPALAYDHDRAREMLGYGRWILASTLLAFLAAWGDDAFLGWYLGAAALGVYQLAYRLSNAPATEISHTVSRAVFPAYAKLQDDPETLRRGYLLTLNLVALVTVPATVGIVTTAPVFVSAALGPQWGDVVVPLQVLAVYGLIRSIRTTTVPLFRAVDQPQRETQVRVAKLVAVVVFIYPATAAYGAVGTGLAIIASGLVALPLSGYLAMGVADLRLGQLGRRLAFPVAGSALMAGCVLALRRAFSFAPPVEFVLLVVAGVVTYAGAMLSMERRYEVGLDRLFSAVREGVG